jgi:hypothetical protein
MNTDYEYELPDDLPEALATDLGDYDPHGEALEAAAATAFADWRRELFAWYPAVTAVTVGTLLHEADDGLRSTLTPYFRVEFADGREFPGDEFADEEAEDLNLSGVEEDLDVFGDAADNFLLALPGDDCSRWLRDGTLAPAVPR